MGSRADELKPDKLVLDVYLREFIKQDNIAKLAKKTGIGYKTLWDYRRGAVKSISGDYASLIMKLSGITFDNKGEALDKILLNKIRVFTAVQGQTLMDVSIGSGMCYATVNKFYRGKITPRLHSLSKLASFFDLYPFFPTSQRDNEW